MKFPTPSSSLVSYLAIPLTLLLALLLFFCHDSTSLIFQRFANRTTSPSSTNSTPSSLEQDTAQKNVTPALPPNSGLEQVSPPYSNPKIDKAALLLHGLLPPGFDQLSCQSRYQSHLLRTRTASPHKPSHYLISMLRNYEKLHIHCGPRSHAFRKLAKSSNHLHSTTTASCKYLIWMPANGLGNMIVSMAATFLYALLTDRVLLVEFGPGMDGLFCQPFPNSSWILPKNFPHRNRETNLPNFDALLLPNKKNTPTFLYLNIERKHDKPFHCNYGQQLLHQVPVLFLRSDQYFVPSLFMVENFNRHLVRMFPDKETVFHHLGRYLFHPSNQAWGLVTRFYETYLADADQRIGIQIRVFNSKTVPFQTVMDQILQCSKTHSILPELATKGGLISSSTLSPARKAILVASLSSEHADALRTAYWTRSTAAAGDRVGVFQASHEGIQKFEDEMHNMKAWAEIYMLSLCDVLVTSSQSTFGYVGQGLGGVKPWILEKPVGEEVPDPPCRRGVSMEPCFHFPPEYRCEAATARAGRRSERWNASLVFDYLKPCEDLIWGMKLYS